VVQDVQHYVQALSGGHLRSHTFIVAIKGAKAVAGRWVGACMRWKGVRACWYPSNHRCKGVSGLEDGLRGEPSNSPQAPHTGTSHNAARATGRRNVAPLHVLSPSHQGIVVLVRSKANERHQHQGQHRGVCGRTNAHRVGGGLGGRGRCANNGTHTHTHAHAQSWR